MSTTSETTTKWDLQAIVADISNNRLVQPGRPGRRSAAAAERLKLMQPSGPRDPNEGIEDEEQGIISIAKTESGGIAMRCTLLCAGFVLGPAGSSVRNISKATGADIRSETQRPGPNCSRATRRFVIEGSSKSVAMAVHIISAAIQHYKDLCEGAYCGQAVPKSQIVEGVPFVYQPPPRSKVPHAASIATDGDSSSSKSPLSWSSERNAGRGDNLYAGGSILAAALAGRARTPSTDPDSPPRCTSLLADLDTLQNKTQMLRTMSSPLQAARTTTRAFTPTAMLERSTTIPQPVSCKPMSFFCHTPKTARTELVPQAPLVTPFGGSFPPEPRALSPSLQTAFGMATPLQRALQVALQSSSGTSAFEVASDVSHHTSVPLTVTPVQLSSFDALPYGGERHPMEFGADPLLGQYSVPDSLSHNLQGLSFDRSQ